MGLEEEDRIINKCLSQIEKELGWATPRIGLRVILKSLAAGSWRKPMFN
jgi:hypothetical protein